MPKTKNLQRAFSCPTEEPFTHREHVDPYEQFSRQSPFVRDRERIVQSKAFRRLFRKTQIFLTEEGDHFRNRLSHTLEVEAIAIRIAHALRLNLDLVQAIAVGHDLGHTPFGHGGEQALQEFVKGSKRGGIPTFKHNHQSVRIVELLEKQYLCLNGKGEGILPGINLTWAVREGILFHTKIERSLLKLDYKIHSDLAGKPIRTFSRTLEGQTVAVADEIAQIYSDIEDGLRLGLISAAELLESAFWKRVTSFWERYADDHKCTDQYAKLIHASHDSLYTQVSKIAISSLIRNFLIYEVVGSAEKRIKHLQSYDNMVCSLSPIVDFNESLMNAGDGIGLFRKYFIEGRVWNSTEVIRSNQRGRNILKRLLEQFAQNPKLLPEYTLMEYDRLKETNPGFETLILLDHLSGMTDFYARRVIQELFA